MKDGDKLGRECPKCGLELEFYLGFEDAFSYKSGHYTKDVPMAICSDEKCGYDEVLEE